MTNSNGNNIKKVYQMGNISREMETLKKNEKEILEIKNTITKIKNDSDALIRRLNRPRKELMSWKICQ